MVSTSGVTTGTCVRNCGEGMYPNTNLSLVTCVPCVSPCATCLSSTVCLTCVRTPVLYYMYNSQCIPYCPTDNTVIPNDALQTCDPCVGNCATCQNTTSTCLTCKPNFYLQGINCVACSPPMIVEGGDCVSCTSPCATCQGTRTNCTSCDNTKPYILNNTCFLGCPNGYLGISKTCEKCAP